MSVPRRKPLLARAAAAVSAAVLVACTLLVAWHRATVVHGVCDEHGDAVHVESMGEPGAHGHGAAATLATRATLRASDWALQDGDHHCQLLACGRDQVEPPRLAAALAVIAPRAEVPRWGVRAAAPAVRLLRFAPKTSPPA